MKNSPPKPGWGRPSPPTVCRVSRLLGERCSGCKRKVSTGQTNPNPPKAAPGSQEHSGEGSVGARRENHREPRNSGKGDRICPLPSQPPLFSSRCCLGRDAGRKGRRQAWSRRAELLMQSMNTAIPCQAAAEANEEGSLCVGKSVLRLLSVHPRALPLLRRQKEKKQGAFKAPSSRVAREWRSRLEGQQGIQICL